MRKYSIIDTVVAAGLIAIVAIPLFFVMAISVVWAAAEIVYRKVVK